MAGIFKLPLEIRAEIYSYLINPDELIVFGSEPLMPKIRKIDPIILRVNKALSHDAGMAIYRANAVELWVELDCDNGDTIGIIFDTALAALTDESTPPSWQCLLTVHMSYNNQAEMYQARLILHQRRAKYSDLDGAPEGKGVDMGWRSWFSSTEWQVKGLHSWRSRPGTQKLPVKAPPFERDISWRAGAWICGDNFVKYLEQMLPDPEDGYTQESCESFIAYNLVLQYMLQHGTIIGVQ